MKGTSKPDGIVRPLHYLINGCAKSAELTVTAPLKIQAHWARMLHLSPIPPIMLEELMQNNLYEKT
uniref:Uncharacterized protein n=1 Tax=Glossina pallidipes TaxID=7398 RepID=A0A1A9ZTR7_GLOPL